MSRRNVISPNTLPSSSSDEENIDVAPEQEALQQNGNLTSERPGPSCLPSTSSQPAPERSVSRTERDLYWSIINNMRPAPESSNIDYSPETQRINPNCRISNLRQMTAIKRLSRLKKVRRGETLPERVSRPMSDIQHVRVRSGKDAHMKHRVQKLLSQSVSITSEQRQQNQTPSEPQPSTSANAAQPEEWSSSSDENEPSNNEQQQNTNTTARRLEDIVEIDEDETAETNAPMAVDAEGVPDPNIASEIQSPQERKSPSPKSNKALKRFNLKLLSLLECPVCLEWMEPPMAQCSRGHLVCGRCRVRLDVCPMCRTGFSTVRNRAMEAVAELVRYPCRHRCGQEKRLKHRASHEANCLARLYHCPASPCADTPPMPLSALPQHMKSRHPRQLKHGAKHKLKIPLDTELSECYVLLLAKQMFQMCVKVHPERGLVAHVGYIGPVANAKRYVYEITVHGVNNVRKLVYSRATHNEFECVSQIMRRKDCFYMSKEQATSFLRGWIQSDEPEDAPLELIVKIHSPEQNTPDS